MPETLVPVPEQAQEQLAQTLVDSLAPATRDHLPTIVDEARTRASITSQVEYDAATALLTDVIQVALDEIDSTFDGSISQAHQLHKRLLATKRQVAEPWTRAKEILLQARETFRRALEAEQQRQRAELEAAMKREAERAKREEAQRLYIEGRDAEADAILDELAGGTVKPTISLPEVVPLRPKSQGTAVRTLKRFNVLDARALKPEYLIPDLQAIQRVVDAQGQAAELAVSLPGTRAIEYLTRESEAVSRKRGRKPKNQDQTQE